jgi:hypothetical protein
VVVEHRRLVRPVVGKPVVRLVVPVGRGCPVTRVGAVSESEKLDLENGNLIWWTKEATNGLMNLLKQHFLHENENARDNYSHAFRCFCLRVLWLFLKAYTFIYAAARALINSDDSLILNI